MTYYQLFVTQILTGKKWRRKEWRDVEVGHRFRPFALEWLFDQFEPVRFGWCRRGQTWQWRRILTDADFDDASRWELHACSIAYRTEYRIQVRRRIKFSEKTGIKMQRTWCNGVRDGPGAQIGIWSPFFIQIVSQREISDVCCCLGFIPGFRIFSRHANSLHEY